MTRPPLSFPKVLRIGQRLLRCTAKYFASDGRFAAAGNAALLGRALQQRVWEDSPQQCRQLPQVGRLIGQRLQDAGLGAFHALLEADPRRIELAAQRCAGRVGWGCGGVGVWRGRYAAVSLGSCRVATGLGKRLVTMDRLDFSTATSGLSKARKYAPTICSNNHGRAYPFGATLQSGARALLPPTVHIALEQQGGSAGSCTVTLTRLEATSVT